ncbi:murein transglycosylase A [Pelistega europaea]|uniref:peptidoglycan lytic exotransglycosylase n=1 Tax=Pelistega europaea TaxID=106147 RepID=A0A7Y4L957_9BURK|nr:MltA domain-containing protein [Pelistega europaea]NOL49294.1 murein transglycosylase A [Pelistega europaea]
MKRILATLAMTTILAACSSTSTYTAGESASFDMHAPLQMPDPSVLRDTPPRALKGKYVASDWSKLPGWNEDDGEYIWLGLVNNCKGLMRPVSGSLSIPARSTPQSWYDVCQAVANMGMDVDAVSAKQFLQQYLRPWAVVGDNGSQGLVTGYYEPVVHGSRSQGGAYQWPMYAPPADLLTVDLGKLYPELVGKRVRGKVVGNKVVPYDTRAEITSRSDQPPVIVWLDDPVEAFFLQVQGSGRVMLDGGGSLRLAYADHNGRPYTSIGKWLASQGELPIQQASMQNIKEWARNHPDRVNEMMNVNQAMVFFKEEAISDEVAGPKGAYGIPLIAKRTIAVDANFVPLGAPVFLATSEPGTNTPLRRVVFAQDTGAAIKGAARADFFWGSGDEAGNMAGRMKQAGFMWILWPREAGAPSAR